jgi:sec-independent protein translocase protein TatC
MALGLMLVFQMPTIAFFLARMGMVTSRFLLRHFGHAVLIAFVVAAVVTPSTDPWNQTVLGTTMIVLYALCIGIVAVFGGKRHPQAAAGLLICATVPVLGARVVPFRRGRDRRV